MNLPALPPSTDIASFLGDSRWRDRFDDEILAAANSLVSKVRDLRTEETAPGSVSLLGMVAKDEAEVNLWQSGGGWEFETFCSCDIGNFCHHAAALLAKAAKERDPSRLQGRGIAGAVAAALPSARELMHDPPPDLPRLRMEARFELRVNREPVDKATRLLLQSLGQPNVDFWISAEASVVYGPHRSSLRSSAPDWVRSITHEGRAAILQHDAAAENAATQQLRDTGLSSLQSNSAWKFLLNLKSRETSQSKSPDRWFPDPGRVPTDAFWHQFRGEMVAKLESLGWLVSVSDNVGHRVHEADPANWQSSLDPGDGGWFSLSVGFDVAGQRYDLLPILAGLLENDFLEETLDRPDNGHIYAPLPDGDALKLPIGRVRKILNHLSALIDPKFPDKARLHALDAASLAGLDGLGIDTPPQLAELAAKLKDFSGIDPVPTATGLQATLRDYQLAGFHWMQFLARHELHGILGRGVAVGALVGGVELAEFTVDLAEPDVHVRRPPQWRSACLPDNAHHTAAMVAPSGGEGPGFVGK